MHLTGLFVSLEEMDDYDEPAPFDWIGEGIAQASTEKRKYNKKRRAYVGWGSKELIEFLGSVGKDTTKALSQQEVTAVINQYVHEKNLINPAKKKRVLCDEKLQSLFGRKQSIARNKIYDLLDTHLAENQVDSDGYKSGSADDNDEDYASVYKKQKFTTLDKKTPPKKAPEVPKDSPAAITAENIKLVFLRRTLVQELLSNPESFENKVVGSFVRVKSDPHDIYQKNSHEIHLVIGVVDVAPTGGKRSALLQISRMADNIQISELSDDNFSKEEIEDLRRRVKDGLLKQPTVGELATRVALLHEDITKHWLAKELVLLKNLIDHANEKGARYKVLEYSDRKKLLESPAEQSRLFSEIPNVIPEEVKADTVQEASHDDSPKVADWDWERYDDSPKAADWDWEPYDVPSTNEVTKKPDVVNGLIGQGADEISTRSNGYAHHPSSPKVNNQPETSFLPSVHNGHARSVDQGDKEPPNNIERTMNVQNNGHSDLLNPYHFGIQKPENRQENNGHFKPTTLKEPQQPPVVIDLSDDDDDDGGKEKEQKKPDGRSEKEQNKPGSENGNIIPVPHPEHLAWLYYDPQGRVQGPFSLMSLKRWSDLNYFPPDFKVWLSFQTPDNAVLLSSVLQYIFRN